MPNGPIRIKIPAFDSALEIVLITNVKCITKHQCSSDLWPLSLKAKRQKIIRQKIAVIAAMIHGILFSLYGNCRNKIRALSALLYDKII
jgi:hypothetical protein